MTCTFYICVFSSFLTQIWIARTDLDREANGIEKAETRKSFCDLSRFGFRIPALQLLVRAQWVKNLPAMKETWVRTWVGKIPWRRA